MHQTLASTVAVCLTLIAAGAAAQTAVVVDGAAETTAGGVTFPDATTQTTAARREYYAGVVLVAQSGGQFTSIQAALDSITGAAADNRYLVLVAPGVYAGRVTMKSWVDIEGFGPGATVITAGGGSIGLDQWTVRGADDAALRSLTVQNTGGAPFAYGIDNVNTGPRLQDLIVDVSGATDTAWGISNNGSSSLITGVKVAITSVAFAELIGVDNWGESSVDLRHVEIDVSGPGDHVGLLTRDGSATEISFTRVVVREGSDNTGIWTLSSDPAKPATLRARHLEVEIAAGFTSYGVRGFTESETTLDHAEVEVKGTNLAWAISSQDGGPLTVLHSRVEAKDSSNNRALSLSTGTIQVGNSLIDGAVSLGGTGSITCVGAFDDNYTALDATCQ